MELNDVVTLKVASIEVPPSSSIGTKRVSLASDDGAMLVGLQVAKEARVYEGDGFELKLVTREPGRGVS